MSWNDIESKWRDMTSRARGAKPSATQSFVPKKLDEDTSRPDTACVEEMAVDAGSATSLPNLRAL